MSKQRTLRSRLERVLLWYAAQGKCQLCGCDLPQDWHADHIEPYSITQQTNLQDMQALCPGCNIRKANGFMDLSKARIGQVGAHEVAVQRKAQGQNQTALVLACAYGKSHLQRMIAFTFWNEGLSATTVSLSPNEYLRDQLVSRSEMSKFVNTFRPVPRNRRKLNYKALRTIEPNYNANDEFLLSATIQLVSRNADLFCKWIRYIHDKTGMDVTFIVDETHTNSEKNIWGDTLAQLRDAGAHIIVMTATAMREDGDPLFGFDAEEVKNEPITIVKTRKAQDPLKVHIEIWEGTRTHFRLLPHYHVTFKQAWNEGVLCHVNHHPFDIELQKIDMEQPKDLLLSDLSETDTRKVLGKLVRHPEVIRSGCQSFLLWLQRIRAAAGLMTAACSGIVFCANDGKEDEKNNKHAEDIKAELLSLDPSLKILIATSADDTSGRGPSGKKILEDFVYNDVGDIIIVKQMAGLGLDSPRSKIALDLSPVRTATSFIQRTNRITRPYNGIMVAHLVTLADVLSQACFTEFIESQGGATTKDLELVHEDDVPKNSEPEPLFHFKDVKNYDIRDTKDKRARFSMLRQVFRVMDSFPLLATGYTIPEIAERLHTLGALPLLDEEPEPEPSSDTGNKADRLKARILATVKDIVRVRMTRQGRHYSKDPQDQAFYQQTIKGAWKDVYQRSRMPEDFDYQHCTDIPMLNGAFSAAQDILEREAFA